MREIVDVILKKGVWGGGARAGEGCWIHSRANRHNSREINNRHLAGGVCSEPVPDKEEDVEVVPEN